MLTKYLLSHCFLLASLIFSLPASTANLPTKKTSMIVSCNQIEIEPNNNLVNAFDRNPLDGNCDEITVTGSFPDNEIDQGGNYYDLFLYEPKQDGILTLTLDKPDGVPYNIFYHGVHVIGIHPTQTSFEVRDGLSYQVGVKNTGGIKSPSPYTLRISLDPSTFPPIETSETNFDCKSLTIGLPHECEALLELYRTTNGKNWDNKANWFTPNLCSWFGVNCSNQTVTSLNLNRNKLNGYIPSEIEKLTNLRHLELNDNTLSGELPLGLFKLSQLIELSISNNNLFGPIPSEIGNLTDLSILELRQNKLNGMLPKELGQLSNLSELKLSFNNLSGDIPNELSNLESLTWVSLNYNELSGSIPSWFERLPLERIGLVGNEFTGSIPKELGSLTNLEVLGLEKNKLSGHIPTELGNLSKLRVLTLSQNLITGEIPSEIGNLTNLEALTIYLSQLSGSLPASFSQLDQLYLFEFDSFINCVPPNGATVTWISKIEHVFGSTDAFCDSPPPANSSIFLPVVFNKEAAASSCEFAEIEQNDTRADATKDFNIPMCSSVSISGIFPKNEIDYDGLNRDVFRFVVTQKQSFTIQLLNIPETHDYILYFTDADGDLLTRNGSKTESDNGSNANEEIILQDLDAGTYFIGVFNKKSGNYWNSSAYKLIIAHN